MKPERPEPSRAAAGSVGGNTEASGSGPGGSGTGAPRPLVVIGLVGALWCIGIGLAVLTTITLIGWIAAPRTALGPGLPGVFRTVVNFWLVSHHAGFTAEHGRVGLLPLGVLVLPGALLYRGGGWMIRAAGMSRTGQDGKPGARTGRPGMGVVQVAVALAAPYAVLAGLLALAAASPAVKPSAWQALLACFLIAMIAGALGAARAVVAQGGRVRSGLGALLRLLPDRPRSLLIGVAGAVTVLLGSGSILVGASLALHMSEADRLYDTLAPGVVGGALLLLVELAYLPNAVIWGMAYAIGPGFSVGEGTSVSPTGVFLDAIPAFPPLAALPEPGPAPLVSLLALAAPFAAGAVGGVLTVRAMPSPVYEGAPLWGFLSGALTGAVTALLSALSGGPLGGGRMDTMGPSPWQVGLLAALEVGISAAIAAWIANWRIMRRSAAGPPKARGKRASRKERPREDAAPVITETVAAPAPAAAKDAAPSPPPRKPSPYTTDPVEFEEAEPVLAPRRSSRARSRVEEPLPELIEEPKPEPEPEPEPVQDTRWTSGTEILVEEQEPLEAEGVPLPREEPLSDDPERDERERTENRGGAIYVLREDPRGGKG